VSKENEGCLLLAKTKALAIKKGLDSELVVCQTINLCDGVHCIFMPPEELKEEPQTKAEFGLTWD
jgi:hypothetical protein